MIEPEEQSDLENLNILFEKYKQYNNKTIEEIITDTTKQQKSKKGDIIRDLYELNKKGRIGLINPKPPKSFTRYIFSLYSLWFWITGLFLILTLSLIYLLPQQYPFNILRFITGTLFSFYLPGYVFIETLYPQREHLETLERIGLEIVMSIVLIPLITFVLNYTKFGIRLDPSFVVVSIFIIIFGIIGLYRKYGYWRLEQKSLQIHIEPDS